MDDPLPVPSRLRELVLEAHRRSLWQVMGLYLVISWIGYEVVLALTEGVGLPAWVPGFAIVLFVIGLPVVVATAFVQEGIPGRDAANAADAGDADGPAGGSDPGPGVGTGAPPPLLDGAAKPRIPGQPDYTTPIPTPGASVSPAPGSGVPERRPSWLFTWSGAGAAGFLAFATLALITAGFMGMRTLGIGPVGTLVAKGELEARDPLVVADFDPLSGDSSLAIVVTEGLRADLAQSSFVTVADRARVRETLGRMLRPADARLDPETAREVAQRLGLKAVLEGEVGRAGAGWLLSARVVTADSARTLAAFRATATDSTELVGAIEELSRSLRERVGESLRAVRASAPLVQVTTPSLPALRKAAEASREQVAGNALRAIRLLNDAVELDPGFAMAWHMLAIIHYNGSRRDATLQAVTQALAHQDRLDEARRHRVRAFHASITGRHREAFQEELEVVALRPDDPKPHISLSDIAWNLGDWNEAASQARQALAKPDHEGWVAHWNLVVALLDAGRVADARQASAEARAALPAGHDIPAQLIDMVRVAEGRWDSMALQSSHPFRAGLAYRTLGRWTEAEAQLSDAGGGGINAVEWWQRWDRFVVLGDSAAGDALEAALDSLDSMARAGFLERGIAELGVAMAMDGRIETARRARALYEDLVPPEVRWPDAYLLLAIDGFVALHEGRVEHALTALHEARESTVWTAPTDAFLGRAWDTLGRPDSAIAAYTRYVETPWAYRIGFFHLLADPVLLVPVHARLAYLYDEIGDPTSAARHAAAVLHYWDGADPDFQPQVAAMRRILQSEG